MTRAAVLRTVAKDLNSLVEDGTLGRWALCGGLALADPQTTCYCTYSVEQIVLTTEHKCIDVRTTMR